MSWHYQIIKYTPKHALRDQPQEEYGLFEVYEDDDGRYLGRTENPELTIDIEDVSESVTDESIREAFKKQIEWMLSDIERPIVDETKGVENV